MMSKLAHAVRKADAEIPQRKMQPAEYIDMWAPMLRKIEREAQLDFSFSQDGITITDMRMPQALRTGVLYTRPELEDNLHSVPGDVEKRMNEFLRKG